MLGEDILANKVLAADLIAQREELEHLQQQILGFSREFQVFNSGDQQAYEEILLKNFLLDIVRCLRLKMEESPRDYSNLTREIQHQFKTLSRVDYFRRVSNLASKELGYQIPVEVLELRQKAIAAEKRKLHKQQ